MNQRNLRPGREFPFAPPLGHPGGFSFSASRLASSGTRVRCPQGLSRLCHPGSPLRPAQIHYRHSRPCRTAAWSNSPARPKWTLPENSAAKYDAATSTLVPATDGETTAVIHAGCEMVQVPVKVKNTATPRPLSFRLDVEPVFMRSGCNTGSCHGSARGQDGFRLSLFGYDPAGDYFRLTREYVGRRIDLAISRTVADAGKGHRRRDPHGRRTLQAGQRSLQSAARLDRRGREG